MKLEEVLQYTFFPKTLLGVLFKTDVALWGRAALQYWRHGGRLALVISKFLRVFTGLVICPPILRHSTLGRMPQNAKVESSKSRALGSVPYSQKPVRGACPRGYHLP